MFRKKFFQRVILVVLFVLSKDILWNCARCDELLAKDLEAKILAFVNDLEFGLVDFASEALLTIESSPDSEFWFKGTAKFSTFKSEGIDYKQASWNIEPIEDTRSQRLSNYFDFQECAVSKLRIRGADYVNIVGLDRWMKDGEHLSPCVVVIPTDWAMIYPFHFNLRRKVGEPTIQDYFRSVVCVNATQIDDRTTDSIWYDKLKTKDGAHLGFQEIRVKDELPVLYETYSYQKGFRDLTGLPRRKDCLRVNRVETTWAKFDDCSVPKKVIADLSNLGSGGIQDLHLIVDLRFWNSKNKEYEDVKKVVDEAIQEVEALAAAPKTK